MESYYWSDDEEKAIRRMTHKLDHLFSSLHRNDGTYDTYKNFRNIFCYIENLSLERKNILSQCIYDFGNIRPSEEARLLNRFNEDDSKAYYLTCASRILRLIEDKLLDDYLYSFF